MRYYLSITSPIPQIISRSRKICATRAYTAFIEAVRIGNFIELRKEVL